MRIILWVCLIIWSITGINTTTPLLGYSPQPPLTQSTHLEEDAPAFTVRVHPDGGLYAGDQVSLEVTSTPVPEEGEFSLERLVVKVTGPVTVDLPPVDLNRDPGTGELKAALLWSWDTTDAPPGSYTLEFTTSPDLVQWTERLELHPSTEMSPIEQQARWAVKKTACCEIHYITGTAAERDLDMLARMADEEARAVSSQLKAEFNEPVQITFLSRVLGARWFRLRRDRSILPGPQLRRQHGPPGHAPRNGPRAG